MATAKPSGWMRGVVKEVLSGDTLVIMGAVKAGIPPEKRLTLSSLIAPKLGRRDGSTRDEPFAWQAREFMRKLCVGKPCVFRVEYALEQAGGREFGSVFVNEKENAALALVGAGLAKVRPPGGQQSPYYEELAKAAEAAEAKGVGMYTKDKDAIANAVRPAASTEEFEGAALLAKVGKGRQVEAIVEAVNSGSTLRVTLLPSMQNATIMVAGVQCPSMGRRPVPPAAAAAPEGGAPESAAAAVASGGPAAAEAAPEPFAREAKHFTELRVLNKEVAIVLEGVSQFGVLVGSVLYPAPAAAAAGAAATANSVADAAPPAAAPAQEDLATALMRAGLARGAEWSLNMMSSGAFRLRELERAAKQQRVGQWHNYVPQTGNSAKLSDKFSGKVVEVVSGDCLVVKDKGSGVERRINLSSVRTPRMGTRDRQPEPYATEAKEFLRQRLIGKEVSVSLEYNRKVQAMPGEGGAAPARPGDERVMSFGTVTISEGAAGGDEKVNNVAELLLVRGLGTVVKHRGDEERSAHYEELMNAEEQGRKGRKGVHSAKEAPLPRVNDISLPGAGAKAKQHLPFLQRAGRMQGVCEYVLSAHKLKISVPKEGVTFAFSPSGVRCPQRAQAAAAGKPAVEEEPYADEALAFTREHVLQRDVEVEVEAVDKAGTFLGTLRVPAQQSLNLGVALLKSGLAKLHPAFDAARVAGGPELAAAQDAARKQKLKVWEKDEPAQAASQDDEAAGSAAAPAARESVEVIVTEVIDAGSFCVQLAAEPRVGWIAEQLAGLGLADLPPPAAPLKAGDKCIAQYAGDGQWYRATVEKAYTADPTSPQYDVHFMDFGNRERMKGGAVRPITPALAAVPAQAHQAALAFVKAPGLDDDYGVEAAQMLAELVGGGKRLSAVVELRERLAASGKTWGAAAPQKLHLTVFERAGDVGSTANAKLLAAGLARFAEERRAAGGEVAEALREVEEKARRAHVGMWRYGDPGEDSDQDEYPSLGGRSKQGGRR